MMDDDYWWSMIKSKSNLLNRFEWAFARPPMTMHTSPSLLFMFTVTILLIAIYFPFHLVCALTSFHFIQKTINGTFRKLHSTVFAHYFKKLERWCFLFILNFFLSRLLLGLSIFFVGRFSLNRVPVWVQLQVICRVYRAEVGSISPSLIQLMFRNSFVPRTV
jgi:hypothetical protein